jgi:putative PIN family toxin of toxin-antitoxin system
MRTTKTLSVTLPPEMLTRAEKLAKRENRTMSELVREALRQYERQHWWDQMNVYGRRTAEAAGIKTEDDVLKAIHAMGRKGRLRKKSGKWSGSFSTATFTCQLLVFGGAPRHVVEGAEQDLFELYLSDAIKTEVERVLAGKFEWPVERIREATSYLWSLAHSVIPSQTVTDCIDPDDNRILECVLKADAQVIVTGDDQLVEAQSLRQDSNSRAQAVYRSAALAR